MNTIFATKRETRQAWTASGVRIPVTVLRAGGNVVFTKDDTTQVVGFGVKKLKNTAKAQSSLLKKLNVTTGMRQYRKVAGTPTTKNPGETITPSEVLAVGDLVKVTGTSKGTGFTGVMKRHGFHGGPKTHGQSDRSRAPGASSSGTELGHLWRGKKMGGRGGGKNVSILNLQVVAVDDATGEVLVKGVVPGSMNSIVSITKIADGKFEGLFVKETAKVEEKIEAAPEVTPAEEPKTEEAKPEVEEKKEEKKAE